MMKAHLKDRLILFAATGFGLGKAPFAPGTFGTLAGIPLIWLMAVMPGLWSGFVLTGIILVSVFTADRAEALLGVKDPGAIVIDEMAGYCVTMSLVPVGWASLGAGFILFRCFDIFKPWPVIYFEKNFTGGAGIVLDDLMAGMMAGFCLKLINWTGLI